MPNKDTGGPAFPATVRGPQAGRNMKPLQRFEGMTLRDYFAAKAMPFIYENVKASLIEDGYWNGLSDAEASVVADDSYAMADAMLEARK